MGGENRRHAPQWVNFADVLQVKDVEVRAGARLLLSPVSFQVAAGDRIGWWVATAPGKQP